MVTKKTKKPLAKKPVKKTTPRASGSTYFWNVRKFSDIEAAKQAYDIHTKRGFKTFTLDKKGNKHSPMTEFDPSVGGMLFVPPR